MFDKLYSMPVNGGMLLLINSVVDLEVLPPNCSQSVSNIIVSLSSNFGLMVLSLSEKLNTARTVLFLLVRVLANMHLLSVLQSIHLNPS